MSGRVSLTNQVDATAREVDFQEVVALQPAAMPKYPAEALPTDGWVEADTTCDYHRLYDDAETGVLLDRNSTFEGVVLSGLFTVFVALCRQELLDGYCDADLFDFLLVELLWRTQPTMRAAQLDVVMSDAFSEVWTKACQGDEGPGINRIKQFHKCIIDAPDFQFVSSAASLFNFLFCSVTSLANHVVLDEMVVNYTSHVSFASHKKNASDPELLVAAMPVAGTGTSCHFWLLPRLWAATRGPSMDNVVQQCCNALVLDHRLLQLAKRPLLVLDARFLSQSTVRWLLDAKMPFLGPLNTMWHSGLCGYIEHAAKAVLKARTASQPIASVTFERGSVSIFNMTRSTTASTSAPAKLAGSKRKAAEGASTFQSASSTRPRRAPTVSTKLKDFVTTTGNSVVDDGSSSDDAAPMGGTQKVGGLPKTEPLMFAEWYAGAGDQKRKVPQLLFSNAIVKEPQAARVKEIPLSPLARAFESCWRRVDQANKTVKEDILLEHHMTDTMLWFDILLSTCVNTTFVLAARKLGRRIHGDGANYTLQEFGMEVACLCVRIRRTYGGRRRTDKTVSSRFFRWCFSPHLSLQSKVFWNADSSVSQMVTQALRRVNISPQ
jgi:hypothetical protein